MRALLALLLLLSFAPSDASAIVLKGATRQTITVHATYIYRKLILCLIGDTQNIVSQDDQTALGTDTAAHQQMGPLECRPNQDPTNCLGGYCAKSPYCDGSWHETGNRLMQNLAHAVTGRWDLVDNRGIRGKDAVPERGSALASPHRACDAVLSLGDMADIDDAIISQDPNYVDLGTLDAYQHGQYQIDVVTDFWKTIDKSGIPYVTTVGNHDPNQPYKAMMVTSLNFSAKSFYYGTSPSGLSHAIKFPTNTGLNVCAVSVPYGAASTAYVQTEYDWAYTQIGCGGSLPTVLVSHYNHPRIGLGSNTTGGCPFFTTASEPIFMLGYGHDVATPGSLTTLRTTAVTITCTGGQTAIASPFYEVFANWQELDRHGYTGNLPFGNTPSDSAGAFYRVVEIDPRYSTILMYDYSPYWFDRGDGLPAGLSGAGTSTFKGTFDWNTRYCSGSPC